MKIHAKPIIALASGAILLSGLLCQTAQAQTIVIGTPGSSIMQDNLHVRTAPVALTVDWDVTLNAGVYTYDYTILNPSGDSGLVESFSVGFNSADSRGALVGSPSGNGANNAGLGVIWNPTLVAPGGTSATLSFQSDDAPVLGNASANGNPVNPAPWSSYAGSQVPVPNAPDSTNTITLLACVLLLLPFGSAMRKKAGSS
jgi:hypothetical protein